MIHLPFSFLFSPELIAVQRRLSSMIRAGQIHTNTDLKQLQRTLSLPADKIINTKVELKRDLCHVTQCRQMAANGHKEKAPLNSFTSGRSFTKIPQIQLKTQIQGKHYINDSPYCGYQPLPAIHRLPHARQLIQIKDTRGSL